MPGRISIVIPTYRRERLLPRLLERCAAQEGVPADDVEIVVVDNTPEATARPVVDAAAAVGGGAIRYVHEPRPGISHARNRGVAEATGDLVAFIDDDEVPSATWLARLLETLRDSGADAVLGPVHPICPGGTAPGPLAGVFRSFFTQSSGAPTGTRIRPNAALRSRRFCYRPLASNNALLVRARCFGGDAEPFDVRLGALGGEDTLFFTRLHHGGRRIVWCREAVVHEHIPPERLTVRFLLRRKFRDGQITSSTCLLLDPPRRAALAAWLAVGVGQVGVGCAVGLLAWPFRRDLGVRGLCMASTGLGKLMFSGRFRRDSYGAGAGGAAANPAG